MTTAHRRNKIKRKQRQEDINTALALMLGRVSNNDINLINQWRSWAVRFPKPTIVFKVEDEIRRLYPYMNMRQAEEHARHYCSEVA
jgi:hypothetical protein